MGDMSREPSMEEILSSIRRVIARDEAQIAGGLSAVARATTAADDGDDDVLDLTETEAGSPVADSASAAMAGGAPPPATPDPARRDKEVAPMFIRAPAAVDEAATTLPDAEPPAEPIVSPAPQAAARQQLDTLTAALAAAQTPEPRVADHSITVNGLVEAALRPMLRDWLDANLPDIVERMVAREIARISGTVG